MTAGAFAQQQDSLAQVLPVPKNSFINNIFQDAVNSISKSPDDTVTNGQETLLSKSERQYMRYEGKYIRKIHIRRFGFEQTFKDTSNRITYIGTQILNALHTDTRAFVIRNNLFIREKTKLNPYELADNERYLRTIEFIQDARIAVIPLADQDSVDLIVITKDLFSITGILDMSGLKKIKARVAEANFLGMGQRIQGTGLLQQDRDPKFGYELLYSKNNMGGSFINATVAYTLVNTGSSKGTEDEKAFFFRLNRPLVSPFSHFAGGGELSFNGSVNYYDKPDSIFYDYHYNVYDIWLGYNLGTRHIQESANYTNKKNHTFIAARYFKTDFLKAPVQVGERYDPIYNSRQYALGQITFFKQEFYKMNYLYGFGTTEDLPTGYSIALTGGWSKQLDLERPYTAFSATQYLVTPQGGFLQASFKLGGYYYKGEFQDAGTLASINYYTRLLRCYNFKLRQLIKFSFTQLDNRVTYIPLRLNNSYGLSKFSSDSVFGKRRISAYVESVLYTKPKIFGFHFAPFIYAEGSMMSPEDLPFDRSDIYTGFGGGIRTRNENLIFGTIELRTGYLPRPVAGVQQFYIDISSDLRFRYRTNFVKAPDVIQLNNED